MASQINRTRLAASAAAVFALAAVALGACGDDDDSGGSSANSDLPQGSEPVKIDPADFTPEIDNPYWPMSVGSRWVYNEVDLEGTKQRVVVTVTDKTKQIANGVEARVVHDVVSEGGKPVEITDDWYAQDSEGNIWYMGEDTAEYENGKVVTRAGSFEAGVDGAQPGIALPASPEPGMTYRQEYYAGHAEDEAKVLALDSKAEVPFGQFKDVLQTRDTNPLEPKVEENKLYVRDVGPVLTLDLSGGTGREELLAYTSG
jgi:hypothetical protein